MTESKATNMGNAVREKEISDANGGFLVILFFWVSNETDDEKVESHSQDDERVGALTKGENFYKATWGWG